MKIVSGKEMSAIDLRTQEEYFIPGMILMENAGIQITDTLLRIFPEIKQRQSTIGILVGSGNNGGDGLVVARQLFSKGIPSTVYLVFPEFRFKDHAQMNFKSALALGISIVPCYTEAHYLSHRESLFQSDFLLDALFGTGLTESARGLSRYIIDDLNTHRRKTTLAIDVPSGLISEWDKHSESILQCTRTFTIGLPKANMLDYPEKEFVGILHVLDIGFPASLIESTPTSSVFVTPSWVQRHFGKRKPNTHKGSYGNTLIIAGSSDMGGAAILASQAASHSGCGLVTLLSIPEVIQNIRSLEPSIVTWTLTSDVDGTLQINDWDAIKKRLTSYSSCLLGPGCGQSENLAELLEVLIASPIPLILDADGLNLLAKHAALLTKLRSRSHSTILTPHPGEFSRLLNLPLDTWLPEKIHYLREFCQDHACITILKGAVTIVGSPDGRLYFNSTGNNGMAKGGSGDVLAGFLVGRCAIPGNDPIEAAITSAYLHGRAGDIAAGNYGKTYMNPSTIIKCLTASIMEIESVGHVE